MAANQSSTIAPSATHPIAGTTAARVRPNRVLVVLSFLAICVIWGSTYLAIRFAVATIPPLYTAGMRHLTAGTILLLWCMAKRLRPTWAQVRASIVIGAFFFLIGHGTVHWAEQVVPSGLTSLLVATEPIIVFAVTSAAAKRWRINATLVAGVILGLAGVALLMKGSVLTSSRAMITGSIAILIGAISWAAGVVYSRRSHLSGHPLLLSALTLLAGAVQLLIAGTIFREWKNLSLAAVTMRSWLSLAYLILFGSVIAFTAYTWLLEHFSPTLVATHTYVNPIVAVLLGWMFGGEAVTLTVAIAAAMVVLAVVLVEHGTSRLQSASDLWP